MVDAFSDFKSGPSFQPALTTNTHQAMHPEFKDRFTAGAKASVSAVKMHGVATVLMGTGPLVMNLVPSLKMPWKDAFLMTPLHMAWMVLVTAILGFAGGFQGESHKMNPS